jgi:hypothetical protein
VHDRLPDRQVRHHIEVGASIRQQPHHLQMMVLYSEEKTCFTVLHTATELRYPQLVEKGHLKTPFWPVHSYLLRGARRLGTFKPPTFDQCAIKDAAAEA